LVLVLAKRDALRVRKVAPRESLLPFEVTSSA